MTPASAPRGQSGKAPARQPPRNVPSPLRRQAWLAAALLFCPWLATLSLCAPLLPLHPLAILSLLPGLIAAIYLELQLVSHLGTNHRCGEADRLFSTLGAANWITLLRGAAVVALAGFLPLAVLPVPVLPQALAWAPGLIYLGISLADMMVTYVRLGLEAAAQHIQLTFENESDGDGQQLVEPWYNPFRLNDDGTLRRMPQYWVNRIVADHLLHHVVHTDVRGDATAEVDIGGIDHKYPLINTVAMADERGEHMTLLFVNRSLDREYPVAATLSNHGLNGVEGTLFTSGGALDDASIMDIEPRPLDFTVLGSRIYFYLPPHSLAGLRIDAP